MRRLYFFLSLISLIILPSCENRNLTTQPEGMYEMTYIYLDGTEYNYQGEYGNNGYSFDKMYVDFSDGGYTLYQYSRPWGTEDDLYWQVADHPEQNTFSISGTKVRTNLLDDTLQDCYVRNVTDLGFAITDKLGNSWCQRFTKVSSPELIKTLREAPSATKKEIKSELMRRAGYPVD